MRLLTLRKPKPAKAARARRPRRGRRKLMLAALGGALLAVLGAGLWVERSGMAARWASTAGEYIAAWGADIGLTVANIEVEGRERADRQAILDALAIRRGMPILAVDPGAAKRRLESIPWIRSVAVERRFPDTIHIRLVERQPLAYWQRDNRLVLIDREGKPMPGEPVEAFPGLVVLVGEDAPQHGAALLDMLASEKEIAGHVAAAVRVGGRRWNLRLDNDVDVALPEEDPAAAWHRLAEIERSEGILQRAVQMVDLRLPDRLVVRTLPEPPKAAPAKPRRQPGSAT